MKNGEGVLRWGYTIGYLGDSCAFKDGFVVLDNINFVFIQDCKKVIIIELAYGYEI